MGQETYTEEGRLLLICVRAWFRISPEAKFNKRLGYGGGNFFHRVLLGFNEVVAFWSVCSLWVLDDRLEKSDIEIDSWNTISAIT